MPRTICDDRSSTSGRLSSRHVSSSDDHHTDVSSPVSSARYAASSAARDALSVANTCSVAGADGRRSSMMTPASMCAVATRSSCSSQAARAAPTVANP